RRGRRRRVEARCGGLGPRWLRRRRLGWWRVRGGPVVGRRQLWPVRRWWLRGTSIVSALAKREESEVTRRVSLIALACLLPASLGVAGCATEYKKTEENLNKPPINCFTAEGDIRLLPSEKANTLQQMAAELPSNLPTTIAA